MVFFAILDLDNPIPLSLWLYGKEISEYSLNSLFYSTEESNMGLKIRISVKSEFLILGELFFKTEWNMLQTGLKPA